MSNSDHRGRILFNLSGSIACYKSCIVISRLVQEGFEVQVACTPDALAFVGEATLEGLTGRAVFKDVAERGRMMDHIQLARWADLAVLAPATANTINALAAGLASNAVCALFLAYELGRKPYLVAPAMNHAMLSHPATRASLVRLENWGVRIIPPDEGRQACGESGAGRLADPERIFGDIESALRSTR
jgi:phosphopantothenoylcysteine decarboxylase